ncbi:MAG: ABC transporter ATP-binding protein [Syntrophaceae bacterium]|nr:ABC transporter ATP-binding protein [Syntrophaceae bacterium]
MAELRIENLTKIYGDTAVVDRVSFTVAEGEFCILLGPSGCGKSTVLRLIAGLEHQDEGTIHIGGTEVSARDPKDRDVAMVFQSYALYPHLSVYDNIAFPLRIRKLTRREVDRKVREAARMLDIADLLERRPREISGGQRQRVAIGRAIVRSPQLFLFDEPLSNLDAKLRASMRVELAGLHRRLAATTLYVTHDQVEAMTLGQMIVLLDRGIVQQVGSPRDLYDRPANVFAASFIGVPPINLFDGTVERGSGGLFIRCDDFRLDAGGRQDLTAFEGRTVTVGIRPEAVRVGTGLIRGLLEHAEHMGSETILYLRTDGRKIVARAAADFRPSLGEPLNLDFDPRSLHFFFEGRRI